MDRAQVHFEMFVRRHGRAPWALELATEDRREAFEAVDRVLAETAGAAVRLNKETRDPTSGEFRSLVLLERGVRPEPRRLRARRTALAQRTPPAAAPTCVQPEDLYSDPARASIGRLLSGWLARKRVTPFELLHRADLAERLEACETELNAAIYNAASGQAAGRDGALEPLRVALAALVRRTIERLVAGETDGRRRLGALVAERLAGCDGWADKAMILLGLLDAAQRTETDEAGAQVLRLLQQPLNDILGAYAESEAILGEGRSLGERLLTLLQVAAAPQVAEDPRLASRLPRLDGLAARLALELHRRPIFARTRAVMVRRVVTVLAGAAPLWPGDPAREAEGLELLSALFDACGRLTDHDEARAALGERWRRLAAPERIEARLALCAGELEAADVLVGLAGAAVGRGAAEAFGRRLLTLLAEEEFAREACFSPDPPVVALKRLADLAAGVWALDLTPEIGAIAAQRVRRLAAAIALPAVRALGDPPSHEMVRLGAPGGDQTWARPRLRLISTR